jgi:hypothetical protein
MRRAEIKYFVLDIAAVGPGFYDGMVSHGFDNLFEAQERARDETLKYQPSHVIYKAVEVIRLNAEPTYSESLP